jgi:hypothetical protein
MPPRSVPVPRAVRAPATTTPWAPPGPWAIVHVGQSSALLAALAEPSLLAITGSARGLVPDGICVPDPVELARLVAWLRAASRSTARGATPMVDLAAWAAAPPLVERVDLRITPVHTTALAVSTLLDLCTQARCRAGTVAMDPEPLRRLAAPLTAAALAGQGDLVAAHLASLVGAGPGATPTGDDVVVGVLAALDAAAGTTAPAPHVRAARLRIAVPLRRLLGATTAASRHDLGAAIRGELAEHVHDAVRALEDPALGPAVVSAARHRGATSGIDVLSGLALAARTTLRRAGPLAGLTTGRSDDRVDDHLRRTA